MNAITKVLLLCVVFSLAACVTTPPAPIIVPHNVLITPPDDLMTDCPISPPPDKSLTSPWVTGVERDRTALATTAYNTQVNNTRLCNVRLGQLRAWVAQQPAIYATPTSKP